MVLIKCGSYDDMSIRAGEYMGNKIAEILKEKGKCVLGLATGSTPVGLYKELIKLNESDKLSFANVHTYNLDEYIGLEATHDQSFSYFMYDNLFNHLKDIGKDNIHIPDGMAEDYDEFCNHYEEMITDEGGVDLQLLGIGSNGHIGFNEPDVKFSSMTHTVDLTESTIKDNSRFFEKIEDVPTTAVTMGIGTIMRANSIVMVISGKNKASALKQMINGDVKPSMPASVLQFHRNVIVFADEEACSEI